MEAPTPGCWVDSHHGHYAHVEAIKIAVAFGMPIDPFADWTLSQYDECWHMQEYPTEALMDLLDDAESFLNEHQSVEGHYWGWNEGDFGLYPIEDDDGY